MFDGELDMSTVLTVWRNLGYRVNSYHTDNGYRCDFMDNDNQVVGYTDARPGGIYWNYPQLVMDLYQYEKGIKGA